MNRNHENKKDANEGQGFDEMQPNIGDGLLAADEQLVPDNADGGVPDMSADGYGLCEHAWTM
jgi:hypothetical protein